MAWPAKARGRRFYPRATARKLKFFVDNPQDHILQFHMRGEFYENEELSMIQKYCKPGSFIADIGANVGNHALFFEKFLSPCGIRVFEVNAAAADILRMNVYINQCKLIDTSFLGIGLADVEMNLAMVAEETDNVGGTRFGQSPAGPFRAVPGDAMLHGQPVNFIKMDVEGMEMAVLRGLERTICTWRPTLFIEVEDQNLPAFTQWTESSGYRVVDRFRRYRALSNYMLLPK